ncbi:hypothetical protein [Paenibacillus sp. 37]|uniref:hypothetical protein n=1 Tax=Paenibacillus sp. 37 TaxID=2607911 RepID=UPI00122E36CB|nr:hypothetical protein [Paenibacillus sp. 37]
MPFDNSIKNLQTPERVRALCQLVEYAPYTKNELLKLLQPPAVNSNESVAADCYSFTLKGKLIVENDDRKLVSNMAPNAAQDPVNFRREIIRNAHQQPDLVFHRFTAWALGKGQEVMTFKSEKLVSNFFSDVTSKTKGIGLNNEDKNREYNTTNVKGWMNWASYLGYGFEHKGSFLVNPALRMKEELMFDTSLDKGKWIPIREFMSWLALSVPELDGGIYNEQVYLERNGSQHLSYALSTGLRSLHSQGVVQLIQTKDAGDVWHLTPSKLHEVSSAVTAIKIVGGHET